MSGLTRRAFLVSAGVGATALVACRRDAAVGACDDATLSRDERAMRAAVGYAEPAPDPAKSCGSCAQFTEGDDGCGGCRLLRGRIHPLATCRAFAPRA